MTRRMTRVGLGVGAALVAIVMAAGVWAANGNTSGDQPLFRGGQTGRRPMGPGGMGPMGLLGPIQRLGLTDEQKNQVKTIMESHADEFETLGERARTAHRALNEAIMADPVQDAAIRQKSAEAAAADADLAVAHAHARAEVVQILTAEQREQLKKWIAEREARRGEAVRGPGH
ncbi:MAG: periplasmic heavy metal sensor [Acidobacteria bacterium]|nr:periplasmic heavy metal sensor [Acidobacteriota bacterium]